MKNISKLLQKSNLTPRERIMLMIKNDIHRAKTGEGILSETDVHAVSGSWKPEKNYEVKEYNKYWKTWDLFVKLEMEMQSVFLGTLLRLQDLEKVLIVYFFDQDIAKRKALFPNKMSDEDKKLVTETILDYTGLEYDRFIHTQTFLSIPESLQKDMESLHPEVRRDHSYFDEEEELSRILKNKKKLSRKDIDKLAALFTGTISWKRVEAMESRGFKLANIVFNGYFAGYDMLNFAYKLAEKFDIEFEDENDLRKKVSELPKLRNEIEIIIREAIEDGLFTDEYTPLCNSETFVTHEGKTKLKHKIIMSRWLKAKEKMTVEIQQHIDNGDLVIEEKTTSIFSISETTKIITGTSIYHFDDSHTFVQDYKKQVEILSYYGYMILAVHKNDVSETYGQLLAFKDVIQKMSDIVGEEVSPSGDTHINGVNEKIDQMNNLLIGIRDKMSEAVYMNTEVDFSIDMYFKEFIIDYSDAVPILKNGIEHFDKKAQEFLGNEWKQK